MSSVKASSGPPIDLIKEFRDKKLTAGLRVYRIENIRVVPYDIRTGVTFNTGDCYIVMMSTQTGGHLNHAIHYWIGEESTQDEYTAVAVYSVHMDDLLGGAPVQYREVQGHESKLFLSYFKPMGGIVVAAGGVKSGFRQDKTVYENSLYVLRPDRQWSLTQVPLSMESLNSHFVYILDTEDVIYLWRGSISGSAVTARYLGAATLDKFNQSKHAGRASYKKTAQGSGGDAETEFFQFLGCEGSLNDVRISTEDLRVEKKCSIPEGLYRVHIEGTEAGEPEKVWPLEGDDSKLPTRDLLDRTDAFIFVTPDMIFVWSGNKSTREEKTQAFAKAMSFASDSGVKVPVERVIGDAEPPDFMNCFADWYMPVSSKTFGGRIAKSNPNAPIAFSKRKPEKMQIRKAKGGTFSMYKVVPEDERDNPEYSDEERETLKVLLSVDKQGGFGELFAGNCYVMLYIGPREEAVFYWLGAQASSLDKGHAAAVAVNVDDERGGKPIQIRQTQWRETEDLLQFFRDDIDTPTRLIVRLGMDPRTGGHPDIPDKGKMMLHVRGTEIKDTRAYEVDFCLSSLNSNDCFIVINNYKKTLWFGKFCNGDERQMCKDIAKRLYQEQDPYIVMEDSPADDTWKKETFGDVSKEYTRERSQERYCKFPNPKLFVLSDASGQVTIEEIPSFDQADLVQQDVMLLFTETYLYVWLGAYSRPQEHEQAKQLAEDILDGQESEIIARMGVHDLNTKSVIVVKQGSEPIAFREHFGPWDDDMWASLPDDVASEAKETYTKTSQTFTRSSGGKGVKRGVRGAIYPLAQLQLIDDCPEDVDREHKEEHLSESDFESTFGMSRVQFGELSEWKKKQLKREAGLF